MGADREYHRQLLARAQGILQGGGRIGGTREFRDSTRAQPTESTDQESWELTEAMEPVEVFLRSSTYILWLSGLILIEEAGAISNSLAYWWDAVPST